MSLQHHTRASLLHLALALSLFGCGDAQQQTSMSQSRSADEIKDVMLAQPVAISPEQVAEVFALGSDSTDLQRDLLKKELTGNVVEWNVRVYEIELTDGVYKILSQPLPIKSRNATNLLRVTAYISPRNDMERNGLYSAKTGDIIRVRGLVQDIAMRMIVTMNPAILIN